MLDTSSSLPESRDGTNYAVVFPKETCSLFGLAPGGVYLARRITSSAGALLPHRFTLTHLKQAGGLLSVALALVLQPVGVTDHPVLWSPDFPLALYFENQRPPGPLRHNVLKMKTTVPDFHFIVYTPQMR